MVMVDMYSSHHSIHVLYTDEIHTLTALTDIQCHTADTYIHMDTCSHNCEYTN